MMGKSGSVAHPERLQMAVTQDRKADGPQSGTRNRSFRGIALIFALSAVVTGVMWWFVTRNRTSTDDAYVKADSAQISSRVAGTVVRVLVDNDYSVVEGQVLVELDPTDYRVAVDKARSTLEQQEAEVRVAEATVTLTDMKTAARVQAAEAMVQAARDREKEVRHRLSEVDNRKTVASADLNQIERDTSRYETLFRQGAGTERQQEVARTDLRKAKAQLGATEAQKAATHASLAGTGQEVDRARAQLAEAESERYDVEVQRRKLASLKARRDVTKSELEAAELNLSYCIVKAPIPGYIAQRSVQVGDRLQVGQAIMAVVPLQDVYVEANYKETQLTRVRIGQPVKIVADMYPGHEYHGKVFGIRAGTGAAFSLLPPENATGNWIKVVQRVPVKILFNEPIPKDHPLRLGMSLEATIDTSDRSGSLLRPAAPAAPASSRTAVQSSP